MQQHAAGCAKGRNNVVWELLASNAASVCTRRFKLVIPNVIQLKRRHHYYYYRSPSSS